MELERCKWEVRDNRLVEQMRQLECRLVRLETNSPRKSTFEKKGHGGNTCSGKQLPVVSGLASPPSWSDASSFDSNKSQPPLKQLLRESTHKDVSIVDVHDADNSVTKHHDLGNADKQEK